ncbi:MAG: electron transfer flavoprotein [Candidatus Cloacimonadota bacterium]|nr:MAG: electron transfer flavoprotein [Candidatus Cloacimonadota bacterium]
MEDEKFDCIIVGGGVAGCAAAKILADNNMKILLVEKGEWTGSKNVSGGVLYGPTAWEIFPELYNTLENPPFERFINRRRLSFVSEESSFSIDYKTDHYNKVPYNGVSVLRSKFDRWLGEQVEEAISKSSFAEDSFVATEVMVESLIVKNGKVCGIKAGEDEFEADCVILAEGVNSLLTRQIGLQKEMVDAKYVASGIKEIWQYDRDLLEAKFQLDGLEGLSNEFVGCTQGIEGGGFLYTNKDSISLGLVLGIKDLRESDHNIYDVLDKFKEHTSIKNILKGGKMVEYSAHVVPVGDIDMIPKQLYTDGAVVVGDAAGLLLNTGKSIEGMNLAMESGRLAALAIIDAKKKKDFSKNSLKNYQDRLSESFVMKDLKNFRGAFQFIHNPDMFQKYPDLINSIMKDVFLVDGQEKQKTRDIIKKAVDESDLSYWDLMKTTLQGGISL